MLKTSAMKTAHSILRIVDLLGKLHKESQGKYSFGVRNLISSKSQVMTLLPWTVNSR